MCSYLRKSMIEDIQGSTKNPGFDTFFRDTRYSTQNPRFSIKILGFSFEILRFPFEILLISKIYGNRITHVGRF